MRKEQMQVGDMVDNPDFDVDCDFEIYDCSAIRKGRQVSWDHGGMKVFVSKENEHIPEDWILDMLVRYITLDTTRMVLVIEAEKGF